MNYGPYSALINWFARNSVAANLLMVILLVGGFYTVLTIKKEIQPRIDTNYITVSVPFLGATPLDVEEGVVIKIEEAIQDLSLIHISEGVEGGELIVTTSMDAPIPGTQLAVTGEDPPAPREEPEADSVPAEPEAGS